MQCLLTDITTMNKLTSSVDEYITLLANEVFVLSEHVKGNMLFLILCNPKKSLVNVCLMKILKSTVTKKVIACFYSLGEESF